MLAAKTVLMFLSQGFEDLEVAAIIDVLGWTRLRAELTPIGLQTCAFHEEVAGKFGIRIRPDHNLRQQPVNAGDFSAFVLPGGFYDAGFEEAYAVELQDLATRIHAQGGVVATMCVGALPVADAGLLQNRRATTYPLSRFHDNIGRLKRGGAIYSGSKVEEDANIISCAGPASALEVAYRLVELLTGKRNADEVKRLMVH